jgi:enamine deaminase RidA (YjgF/YER057c/UK114 family)
MWNRELISSGSPWEPVVGYSRAIKVGPFIYVAGTTATDQNGEVVAPGNPYEQTRFALEKIRVALQQAGAGMGNVVRTRMYVTDITQWEEIARAHGEVFREIRPAATMVEVTRLISPGMLIEIEVDAVLPNGS